MTNKSEIQNVTVSSNAPMRSLSSVPEMSPSEREAWREKIQQVAAFLKEQSSSHPIYKDKPMSYWLALAKTSPNL